ncbi:MAG: RdgB/HAM1 family non-canonical purine NTP pyrophosphatase [Gammaproteobacteria bacterium]|nr:RdgB/HAM1 family non-canonical purine NTP pyrophosphatase [Gammaproteobacteria bacterium]
MTAKHRVVVATGNVGKLKEIQSLLEQGDWANEWEIVAQKEFNISDAEETGTTFVENAIIKARHASAIAQLPALADDSGIEVDYLKGQPGIHSARYAGDEANAVDNVNKLLNELADTQDEQRCARFQCVIVYLRHAADPSPLISQASWDGRILHAPRGDGGFGYDPVFYVPTHDCSAAELDPVIKNAISHRGKALRNLVHLLQRETQASHPV